MGCTFFDTAERYGHGANEQLVGQALAPMQDEVVIATKLFITKTGDDMTRNDLSRQIREHLEASLSRLGTDHVELYYQHRVNKDIPVEDVAACMGELIGEGKILGLGSIASY
ncbi:aldo/keto reductase [Mycobacterium cookii]|uniref:aldo/keto reductase n=1 Tax=Mycobacterium cookii TaxID=1775 RepID=UPI0021F39818|nr:aldo/keto reductase [Mycobacterium cookii]